MSFFLFQKCDTAGAEDLDPSAVLEAAAPDICSEAAFFAPRSKAQEDANVGTAEEQAGAGKPPSLPAGAWVEAAKELVPPPPPPEVRNNEITCILYIRARDGSTRAACIHRERPERNSWGNEPNQTFCRRLLLLHHASRIISVTTKSVKKAHEQK